MLLRQPLDLGRRIPNCESSKKKERKEKQEKKIGRRLAFSQLVDCAQSAIYLLRIRHQSFYLEEKSMSLVSTYKLNLNS